MVEAAVCLAAGSPRNHAVVRITKVFAGEWWPIKGAILALRRLKCLAVYPYPSIEVDL